MPQYLPLPDGSSVTIREGESPLQAYERAKQMYPEAFGGGQKRIAEPTIGGQAKEFFKGLAPGAVGLLESAATGASALLPEETEKRAREGIASLAQAAKAPFAAAPGYEETIGRKFGEAAGSIVPFLGLGPLGLAGRVGMAGLGAGAGAGEARTRAEQEGATAEQRSLATGLGSVVGISEMFAPMRILGRIDEPIKQGIAASLKRVAMAGGEEAAQEAASQAAQNLIAKGIYKPEQAIIEQVGESAAYGGAVGALAQGLMDLALGRRAKKAGVTDEIGKAREEADAARAAEEARKATPEYAREFVDNYEARKAEFVDARKTLKKPGKDATPDVWDAYREQKSALDNLRESLAKDAKEYNKLRGQVAPEREQAAIQTELARLREESKGQTVLPGFESETVTPPAEPTPDTEFVDYAKQVRDLKARLEDLATQAQQTTDLAQKRELSRQYGMAQTALTEAEPLAAKQIADQKKETADPTKRLQTLAEQMRVAEENGDLVAQAKIADKLEALGITDLSQIPEKGLPPAQGEFALEPFKSKTMTKAEAAAQYYKPGTPDIEAQEAEALAEAERQRVQTTEDAERERRLLPETLALKRISERPIPSVGVGQISGAVDRLVEDFLRQRPQPTGRTISGGFAPLSAADDLRAQLNFAKVTDNRELARDTIEQLNAMGEPETDVGTGGQMELGQVAKEAGVEGRQSTDVMKANRVTRASQAQLQSYDRLADFIQTVRESDQNVAQARKDTLRSAAEKLKDQVIGHALNEMDARRAQAGLPELSQQKKLEAVSRMSGVLNELITRGAGLFNMREVPAVVRSGVTVEGARTELPPPGQRLFNNLNAAATSLRGQVRDIIDQIGEIKAPEPRKAGPVRVISGLKLRGEEKERDVKGQFADAKARAKDDEQTFLSEAEAKFNNLSPEAQNLALEQARRVETGRGLDIPAQLEQELADLRRAGESETGQGELFAGTSERGAFRATTNNFIKYLDSNEVRKMQMEIAEQRKQADFQAKRAETVQKRLDAETAKQVAMIDKLTQPWFESPVATARRQFQNVVDKNKAAADLAKEINQKRTTVRTRIAAMVQQVQDAHDKTTTNLKEVRDLYDYVAQQYLTRPGVKKFQIGLDYYTNEVAKAEKAVATSQKALDAAKALQTRVLNDFAKDTVDNAIVREGAKAENKIEEARLAVVKAQAEENAAKATLERRKQERTQGEKAVPAAEQVRLELEPKVEQATYVYRDTSDPSVQAKVALERTNIGKWEGKYEEATTDQAKEIAVKNIEAAYTRMYEALNNAPMRREVRMTEEQRKAQEAFDKAQQDTVEKTARLFEDKAGLPPMRLAKRKVEGVVRVKGGAPRAAIQEQSLAKQEAQFREEEATGEYATKTLEQLAEARAKRDQLQAQIDYIDANKAEARTPARARQNAARTKAVEQRNKLDGQIKRLEAEQKGIEREAKLEKKAVKAVRQERTRMLREPGRLQEAVEGEEPGVFRTATKAGPSLKEQTVKDITDKVMADWSITPEVKVVADEAGLPENIRAQAEAQGKTGQIPGLYDPNTKTVYLVASGLKDTNDVVMTIAHEVTGHFGLREMLGAAYAKNMNRLYDGNKLVKERADAKMAEDPKLSREVAVEEVLADMAETGATPQERNILARVYDFIKRWLASKIPSLNMATVTDNEVAQVVANARRYVIEGEGKVEGGTANTAGLLYRTAKYASPEMEVAGKALDPFVSKQRGNMEKIKANATGLAFETQLVDRFAGFERLAKYLPEHLGTQMMYYLRMYDQRMNMVAQAVAAGAPSIREVKRPDGKTERIIEAKEGANIKNVVETLKDANPMVGNAEAVNRLFTAYMAGIRAKNKGFESLNFGEDVTQADLDKALSVVENNKELKAIFDKARGEYNEYNRNLIQFLVETGAMSKKVADRLTSENDYIPFYREQNGVAQLLIGGEAPIRIGSIKEQPYLKELVGGDQPILDFLTSSVQNTNMLVDMGMRNLATKNAVFELINLNAAKLVKGTPSGKDVVKFKIDGDDRYAVLATEKVKIGNKEFDTGVPADILVKGMEGIPTQMPFIFRAMAMPAQLLRKGVTLSPLYMARQLFRDSLAAPILSGADFTPVLGALKELKGTTGKTLERRGITGGQQFKGTSEDLSMILREVASGKPGWMSALGKFEAAAMEADALTRRAQYNSYIQQGLSEMEATLMSLESMNFNKRGASPSIHIANALIPFFNAQIQGLNVLYKAMTGKMPFNDKLKIRQKMLQRGGMMAAASMVYALLMEDDEAYQNAEPEQKYGNWFVRLPGMDEAVRVPVPFEVGYIFKALPEAIVNTLRTEHGGEEAVKAFKQIVLQTIPGGSSYGIPQALKPAIEVGLGKSFYTGRDILSAREKELLPEEQFRANTTEMAKTFGKLTGASPILMEQLVRGYTGTMGLAFLQALSLGVPVGESPEKAVKRLSEYPVVGGAFQPNDAGGIINSVYERMNDAQKVEKTYEKLVSEGRTNEADALLQRRGNDFMQAELAKEFKSNMNQLIQAERAIQASAMTGEEKRKQLDEIRKLKIAVAKEIRDVADKTVSLSFSL